MRTLFYFSLLLAFVYTIMVLNSYHAKNKHTWLGIWGRGGGGGGWGGDKLSQSAFTKAPYNGVFFLHYILYNSLLYLFLDFYFLRRFYYKFRYKRSPPPRFFFLQTHNLKKYVGNVVYYILVPKSPPKMAQNNWSTWPPPKKLEPSGQGGWSIFSPS